MNKKVLWGLGFVGVVILVDLLYVLPRPKPTITPSVVEETDAKTISVEIRIPNDSKTHTLACEAGTCNLTAFSALQKIGEDDTIAMQFKTYEGLGVMVTELAGLKNGQDNKYWVYEVNEAKVPLAADQYRLSPGDRLLWKFVTPE